MSRFDVTHSKGGSRHYVIDREANRRERRGQLLDTTDLMRAEELCAMLNDMDTLRIDALGGRGTSPLILASMRVMLEEVVKAHRVDDKSSYSETMLKQLMVGVPRTSHDPRCDECHWVEPGHEASCSKMQVSA